MQSLFCKTLLVIVLKRAIHCMQCTLEIIFFVVTFKIDFGRAGHEIKNISMINN